MFCWTILFLVTTQYVGAIGLMRGYQNPFLHRGNITGQRGIALRVTVGRPPTLTKNKFVCRDLSRIKKCPSKALNIAYKMKVTRGVWVTIRGCSDGFHTYYSNILVTLCCHPDALMYAVYFMMFICETWLN